ncbi:MAG: hypothetical protein JRE64_08485 [Deltaproteobacteria bacterium]|nr:hypothetical protein [Deltaproteobacteria bacterium]
MKNQDNMSQILCFGCASIYEFPSDDDYTCPFCSYSIDGEKYKRILEYAKKAVYYGYEYRMAYEKQINDQGKITLKHALFDPVTLTCFIGIAALSGIIGNASYDILKKVIGEILNKSKKVPDNIGQDKMTFFSETNIEIFIQYIREYHQEKSSAVDEVNYEIEKEGIIWNLTDTLYPVLKRGKPTRDEIHEAVNKAFDKRKETKKLKNTDFESFWNNIEK